MPKYAFPVVRFTKDGDDIQRATFNTPAVKAMGGIRFMQIRTNTKYILFDFEHSSGYKLCKAAGSSNKYVTCKFFKALNVSGKWFKLYKTKSGFAIKRNEPICEV